MIIFLSGSIHSGKSTVAKLLSERLGNSAVVEIDAIRDMIAWMPLGQSIPLNLQNAASLIRNFVKQNLEVIVPYPLSQKNYDFLIGELKDVAVDIHVFTLAPDIEKVKADTVNRKLSAWERERIDYHYSSGISNPSFGVVIDSTNQTPEETVNQILARLN